MRSALAWNRAKCPVYPWRNHGRESTQRELAELVRLALGRRRTTVTLNLSVSQHIHKLQQRFSE